MSYFTFFLGFPVVLSQILLYQISGFTILPLSQTLLVINAHHCEEVEPIGHCNELGLINQHYLLDSFKIFKVVGLYTPSSAEVPTPETAQFINANHDVSFIYNFKGSDHGVMGKEDLR